MDYSQFRRTTAIDTGPFADFQDQFNNSGVGKAMGAFGDWVGGSAQAGDADNTAPGSMGDQMGINSVMGSGGQPNTPDDTGYDSQGGMMDNPGKYISQTENPTPGILNNETDESGGYDSSGQWQGLDYGQGGGDEGYAEGGAVSDNDDSRQIPKGAANDAHTDGLASALQTIDDVMMHGYKINGLTGQSQQMPAGGDQAPAFAMGGLVPNAPGTVRPPSFTGTPYQNFMSSARAKATAGRPTGGVPVTPSHSGSAPSPNVPTNAGIQDPGQNGPVGGTPIAPGTYQGHRFDDGGAVEDDDQPAIPDQPGQQAAPQQQQPQQDDPNGGWQGGIPTMDNVRRSMRGLPSPAAPLEAPIKRMLNLIQGGGAMPLPQAQQLEHQSGESDPNLAKIKTAAGLAQSHGPDAAFSYIQALRKMYDLNKTNAAVKASQGNIPQSTVAATNAMHNVLDGTSVHFSPAQGGVRVQVKRLGQSKPKPAQGFDDGGPVDDDQNPAIPETGGDVGGALSKIGHSIADTVISIPQYISLLRGKGGLFDEIYNKGLVPALAQQASDVASGSGQFNQPYYQGEGGQPTTSRSGSLNMNALTQKGDDEESDGLTVPLAQRIGNVIRGGTPAPNTPMPQPRPQEAAGPQIGSDEEPDVNPQPAAAAGDNEPVQPFSKESEQQAWRLYPNIFGDAGRRAEYVRSQGEEEQKHQHKLEENREIWGSKEKIANLVGGNRITIQDMKGKIADRTQAAMTARAFRIADMKINAGRESDLSKRINSYIQSGQIGKITPNLLQYMTDTVNRGSQMEQREAQGPVQIQQATNPTAQQGGPVTQVMRGPDGQLHTFVQTADGKFVPQK